MAEEHAEVDYEPLIVDYLKGNWLTRDQIKSFHYFLLRIPRIIEANNEFRSTDGSTFIRYFNTWTGKPLEFIKRHYDEPREVPVYPQTARLRDLTYAGGVFADIEYGDGTKTYIKRDVKVCKVPMMVQSLGCNLEDKSRDEFSAYGECPLDPGGYFIIKGIEKVFLIHEEIASNKILVEKNNNCFQASVRSCKETTMSKTTLKMEDNKLYIELNHHFSGKVPVMVILKAMGMESDQEVVQMVGQVSAYTDLLFPSIEECADAGVRTELEAVRFLGNKVAKSYSSSSSLEKEEHARRILQNTFLAHIPVDQGNFLQKCQYVALIMRRLLDVILCKATKDDKDYLGNKRLRLSGHLLSFLFEDLFKKMNKEVMRIAIRGRTRDFPQIVEANRIITDGLERTLSTGNLDLQRPKMHMKGVTQVLSRMSYMGALSSLRNTRSHCKQSSNDTAPRALQPSHWGMFCPCDTPVGDMCGLYRNLAMGAHITFDVHEFSLPKLCFTLGVEDMQMLPGELLHQLCYYRIFLNGRFLGQHAKPKKFVDSMRTLRRFGKIDSCVSFFLDEKERCVYIASDGGRVCRPLIIADENGVSKIKEHHMEELKLKLRTFDSFLESSLIEYLDADEENNALIALYEDRAKKGTTHIEIQSYTILGVCAGLIPYLHHNQSLGNANQCVIGKQAIGNIAYNQLCRMDTQMHLLVYPQRPLLTTRTIELVNYDKMGAGHNAIVAVMSYSGYDMEGAIVMNKSSLDRGFGRSIVMKRMSAVCRKYANKTKDQQNKHQAEKMQILDDDGIASPGEIVRPDDIYLNLLPNSGYKSSCHAYKSTEGEASVDRVMLFSDEDENLCIKFIKRQTRRPEVGDKFSSCSGQKGICGAIVQQEDFPFSEQGICPDLFLNPHRFPSGMTVGQLIELLGSKSGVSCGKFHSGSAFGEPSGHADRVETISATLVKHGFSYDGKDFMYSGTLGEPLQAYIFMGPLYYQKLKHMVMDKMHARGFGPRTMLTRQPTEGKSKNGGLRFGEMERDCVISYGASMLLHERTMLSSDPFEAQVCRHCGLLGYYNFKLSTGFCQTCKNGKNMTALKLPYACKLLIQELQSMNIVLRLRLEKDEGEEEEETTHPC